MNEQLHVDDATREQLARLEEHVRCRFVGRLRDFQIEVRSDGLILRGHVHTYYTKQVVQHAVLEMSELPILANEIEVS